MRFTRRLFAVYALLSCSSVITAAQTPQPPTTRKVEVITDYHGTIPDPGDLY